ncbi:MAG: S1 family peptidase [Peptococcaceae bacterium]|nr:S1 family peptidase [Peptococcaceae bacterium]
MQFFINAVKRHRFSFLSLPEVVFFGVGIKITKGFFTGIPSLLLGVKKKLPVRTIPRDRLIPRFIDGLPTDVIQAGRVQLLGYALPVPDDPPGGQIDLRKKRVRPAQPGVSIGHFAVTAGTLGALVKGDFPGGTAILSNNHILANGTDGSDGLSRPGDPVLQPGSSDNGGPNDIIARLHSYSPIIPEKKGSQLRLNTVDAALAVPIEPGLVASPVLGLGRVVRTSPAWPGMPVFKSGRSSGITWGRVLTTGTTIRVESNDKTYVFEDQIGLSSKSIPGDSGSLVVNRFGRAVGLLFAGSAQISFANPIGRVLEYFGVTLDDS